MRLMNDLRTRPPCLTISQPPVCDRYLPNQSNGPKAGSKYTDLRSANAVPVGNDGEIARLTPPERCHTVLAHQHEKAVMEYTYAVHGPAIPVPNDRNLGVVTPKVSPTKNMNAIFALAFCSVVKEPISVPVKDPRASSVDTNLSVKPTLAHFVQAVPVPHDRNITWFAPRNAAISRAPIKDTVAIVVEKENAVPKHPGLSLAVAIPVPVNRDVAGHAESDAVLDGAVFWHAVLVAVDRPHASNKYAGTNTTWLGDGVRLSCNSHSARSKDSKILRYCERYGSS
jgi:hypothetical protein